MNNSKSNNNTYKNTDRNNTNNNSSSNINDSNNTNYNYENWWSFLKAPSTIVLKARMEFGWHGSLFGFLCGMVPWFFVRIKWMWKKK